MAISDVTNRLSSYNNGLSISGIIDSNDLSSRKIKKRLEDVKIKLLKSIEKSIPRQTTVVLEGGINFNQVFSEDNTSSMLIRLRFRSLKRKLLKSLNDSIPESFPNLEDNFDLANILGEDESTTMLLRLKFRSLKHQLLNALKASVPEKFENLGNNFGFAKLLGDDDSSSIFLRMKFRSLKHKLLNALEVSVPEKFENLAADFDFVKILGDDDSSSMLLRMKFRSLKHKLLNALKASVPETFPNLGDDFDFVKILGEDDSSSMLLRMKFRSLKHKLLNSLKASIPETFPNLADNFDFTKILGDDDSSSMLLRMKFRSLKHKLLNSLKASVPETFPNLGDNFDLGSILGGDDSSSIFLRMKFRSLKKRIIDALNASVPDRFQRLDGNIDLGSILGEDESSSILLRMKFRSLKKRIIDALSNSIPNRFDPSIFNNLFGNSNSNLNNRPPQNGSNEDEDEDNISDTEQRIESQGYKDRMMELIESIAECICQINGKVNPSEDEDGGGGFLGNIFGRFRGLKSLLPLLTKLAVPLAILYGVFEGIKEALKQWEESDAETMFGRIVETIFGFLGGFVAGIGGTILNLIRDGLSWILTKLGFEDAAGWLKNIDFKERILEFFDIIGEWFSNMADYVAKIFTGEVNLFEDVGEILSKVMDTFSRFFKAIGAAVWAAIKNPLDAIDTFKKTFSETMEGGNEGRIETAKENSPLYNEDKATVLAARDVITSQRTEQKNIQSKIDEEKALLLEEGDELTGIWGFRKLRSERIAELEEEMQESIRKENEAFDTWYKEFIKDRPVELQPTKEEARIHYDTNQPAASYLERVEKYNAEKTEQLRPTTSSQNLENKPKETGQMIYEQSQQNEEMKTLAINSTSNQTVVNNNNQSRVNNSVMVNDNKVIDRTTGSLQPSYG